MTPSHGRPPKGRKTGPTVSPETAARLDAMRQPGESRGDALERVVREAAGDPPPARDPRRDPQPGDRVRIDDCYLAVVRGVSRSHVTLDLDGPEPLAGRWTWSLGRWRRVCAGRAEVWE
jgi:hypothetical protein